SPLAILELDLQGGLQRWNHAAGEIFGWDGDGDGEAARPALDEGIIAHLAPLRHLAAAGEAALGVELPVQRADGGAIELSVSTAPLRDPEGQVQGLLTIAADITERKHSEERLQQAQRMEAMGRLAGGVAHDFNNLLTVILGYTDLLLRQLRDDEALRPDLEAVKRAGERAAALTGQLLTISRRQVVQPVVLDPNETLASMGDVLARVVG